MSDYAGRGRGHGVGNVPAAAQRQPNELTPEEKARTASSIATNLEHAHSAVVSSLESLWHAHDAHDLPGYLKARKAAESAVLRVRELAIADFGEGLVTRKTKTWMNYDIELEVALHAGRPTTPQSSGGTP